MGLFLHLDVEVPLARLARMVSPENGTLFGFTQISFMWDFPSCTALPIASYERIFKILNN